MPSIVEVGIPFNVMRKIWVERIITEELFIQPVPDRHNYLGLAWRLRIGRPTADDIDSVFVQHFKS